jgi:hypothetical protein
VLYKVLLTKTNKIPLEIYFFTDIRELFSVKYLEAIDGERMKAGDCVNSGVPCSPQIPRAMEELKG